MSRNFLFMKQRIHYVTCSGETGKKSERQAADFTFKQHSEISVRLKHPFSLAPIDRDTHLESLCSKFQLAMILRWRGMRDNMNCTSPLNSVL